MQYLRVLTTELRGQLIEDRQSHAAAQFQRRVDQLVRGVVQQDTIGGRLQTSRAAHAVVGVGGDGGCGGRGEGQSQVRHYNIRRRPELLRRGVRLHPRRRRLLLLRLPGPLCAAHVDVDVRTEGVDVVALVLRNVQDGGETKRGHVDHVVVELLGLDLKGGQNRPHTGRVGGGEIEAGTGAQGRRGGVLRDGDGVGVVGADWGEGGNGREQVLIQSGGQIAGGGRCRRH